MIQFHHTMSDGGYDYSDLIDWKKHTSKPFRETTIQAVSPDGSMLVTDTYDWVGGYKGLGAAKLGKLELWDAKKMTSKPFGFRLMTCYGACFVSGE